MRYSNMTRNTFGQPTFATLHSSANVKVSREEAIRMDTEDMRHLIEMQKLALIVDLDQTIIHVTVDPTVKEWAHDIHNPNWQVLKDVRAFQLGSDGVTVSHPPVHLDENNVTSFATDGDEDGCWYYVKLRPGLSDFLQTMASKYELHVYTMGTRSYADCICRIVDPDGHLFGARILSRDENGSDMQKSLARLFPISTDMVVIIDDRADVWSWSPNLIKVEPYEFFVGIGDINAAHLGPHQPLAPAANEKQDANPHALSDEEHQRAIAEQCDDRPLQRAAEEKQKKDTENTIIEPEQVLTDEDTELELIQALLLEIHQQWYSAYSSRKAEEKRPDVTQVISQMKSEVLRGCELAFSGLIPLHEAPETTMIWRMAEEFGAKCHRTLTSDVTHLVATSARTAKAEQAYRTKKIHVVWPSWLNDSMCRWVRQGEVAYAIPPDTQNLIFPEPEEEDESQGAEINLADMDWGDAEEEVDAFLEEDDEEEENSEAPETADAETTSGKRQRSGASMGSSTVHHSDEDSDQEHANRKCSRPNLSERVKASQDDALRQQDGADRHELSAPTEDLLQDLASEMERELGDS